MAEPIKKRGFLLTAWLVLMLISTILAILFYFTIITFLLTGTPEGSAAESAGFLAAAINPIVQLIPIWIIYTLAIGSIFNLILTIYLFKWKKWAFYGICILAIVFFIFNLIARLGILSSLLGLLGPVILYLILRPKWELLG